MNKSRSFLVAGGVISALLAILHVTLALNPELFVYIAPGGDSSISEMAEQGSSLIVAATAVLALIFAAWALYAFSAAGLVRRLPLLRPALVAIAVIYILRSLFLPTEISMLLDQDYPLRFVLFSTLSLVTGLLYLFGALRLARR